MLRRIMPLLIAAGCIIKLQAMHKEIELKIQLDTETVKLLRAWLDGLQIAPMVEEHTEYYLRNPQELFDTSAGFNDTMETLRIRMTPKGNKVCYKKAHRDPITTRTTHRDEFETTFGDADVMLHILQNAGYTSKTLIKKTRVAYAYTDASNIRYEISFDDVQGLGTFIEIELKSAVDSVAQGLEHLKNFLKSRGITAYKLFDRGYVHMFWNPGFDFGIQETIA